ncbi:MULTISPECIES: hypothetical protein [Actinoalloteichus]|nr:MULTISPECIES: hypothetical protein [Actinoalloteichus]
MAAIRARPSSEPRRDQFTRATGARTVSQPGITGLSLDAAAEESD